MCYATCFIACTFGSASLNSAPTSAAGFTGSCALIVMLAHRTAAETLTTNRLVIDIPLLRIQTRSRARERHFPRGERLHRVLRPRQHGLESRRVAHGIEQPAVFRQERIRIEAGNRPLEQLESAVVRAGRDER